MTFTNREKKILQILLESPNGISRKHLEELLQVSKRTIYRELSNLEITLIPYQLSISYIRHLGYQLKGNQEQINQIKEQIEVDQWDFIDPYERQKAIIAYLLLSDEDILLEGLAWDFKISLATIQKDLHTIEQILEKEQLFLAKSKGSRSYIKGSEQKKRLVLSIYIDQSIGEYEFFYYLRNIETMKSPNYFFDLLDSQCLQASEELILKKYEELFQYSSDQQIKQLIIILAVSLMRIEQNHVLDRNSDNENVSERVLEISEEVDQYIQNRFGLCIPKQEKIFLAVQIEGLKYQVTPNIFLEHFNSKLSYYVKQLIQQVSEETAIDFRQDQRLYYDLLVHIGAALKRNQTLLGDQHNPILEKVINQYHEIFDVIEQIVDQTIEGNRLSRDELAYIVVHFASAIERVPIQNGISVLVFCTSGMGASRMLEGRLRNHFPQIDQIKIMKLSQMSQENFQEYDLILSTVLLPEVDFSYKVISPLLTEEEIIEIQQYLKSTNLYRETIPKKSNKRSILKKDNVQFEQLMLVMRMAEHLLEHLKVEKIIRSRTLNDTFHQIISKLVPTIVSDVNEVTNKIMIRYQTAPIGVPKTNLALFHSSNSEVKQSFFGVYDLDEPLPIIGMDQRPMALKRILLMLAPDDLSEEEQSLLGCISSSIIENDLNTEIYQKGQLSDIKQLLSKLFVQQLQTLGGES